MATNNPGIVVSEKAGLLDTLTALGRYAVVIVGAIPLLLKLLGEHDFAGLIAYFHGNDGQAVVAAVVAIGTAAWGLYKTHKRGSQIATVAASDSVPASVATTK